ncbi:MAG: hypothetical protein ACKPHU_01480, partial [Planctomycetaceae bacterium]
FRLSGWQSCRVDGPLTPDPSPPFHGGEGRISGQRAVFEYEYEYRPPGRTEYEYEGRFLGGMFVCLVIVPDWVICGVIVRVTAVRVAGFRRCG